MLNKMSKKNIFWLTLDATRTDRISCYNKNIDFTENLEKISNQSTLYKNAFCVAPWTYPSICSMFTGLYPSEHGGLNEENKLNENNETIAEYLQKKGYHTILLGHNDGWLNDYYKTTRGFNEVYDRQRIIRDTVNILLPESPKMNKNFLFFLKHHLNLNKLSNEIIKNKIKNINRPWFIYLHLVDNHLPYEPRPLSFISIIRYLTFYKNWNNKKKMSWIGESNFSESEEKLLNRLYDKTIEMVDNFVGELFNILKDDNTIFIITADHGENLGDHELYGHQYSVHDTLLKVPLIIYHPDMKKRVISELFETKDLYYLIKDFVDGINERSYGKDLIYGEYLSIESTHKKLIESCPDLPREMSFIRTKRFKLVEIDRNKKILYDIKNNHEKIVDNDDVMKDMEKLFYFKRKKLRDNNIYKKII